jgi:hypothetical protein
MNEEFLAAIATLAKLAPTIGQPKETGDGLGFCDPPRMGRPVYVDDETGSFYFFNSDKPKNEQKEFVPSKALRCRIQGLRLTTKEYKGKESIKVRLDVVGDMPYMIEKGTKTNFARDLLLSLAEAGSGVKEAVVIEVSEPREKQEKTCFCNIYTSDGQVKVADKSLYNGEDVKYLEGLVNKINEALK